MDKVYGIFSGAYSDWDVHGFLEDKDEAEKYCAVKNQELDSYDSYYIIGIDKMNAKIGNIELKYYYTVTFRFDHNPRNYTRDNASYDYYIGEDKKSFSKYNHNNRGWGWISFNFNADSAIISGTDYIL
jgi:hypothetical protein